MSMPQAAGEGIGRWGLMDDWIPRGPALGEMLLEHKSASDGRTAITLEAAAVRLEGALPKVIFRKESYVEAAQWLVLWVAHLLRPT